MDGGFGRAQTVKRAYQVVHELDYKCARKHNEEKMVMFASEEDDRHDAAFVPRVLERLREAGYRAVSACEDLRTLERRHTPAVRKAKKRPPPSSRERPRSFERAALRCGDEGAKTAQERGKAVRQEEQQREEGSEPRSEVNNSE